jgi:hypothetical protein
MMGNSDKSGVFMTDQRADFSSLTALFINTTLTRSPGISHTQRLIDISAGIMAKQGVTVDQFRAVDHRIATGVYPDMREHGWEVDEWPELFPRVLGRRHPGDRRADLVGGQQQ